jgi:hypothetical protein
MEYKSGRFIGKLRKQKQIPKQMIGQIAIRWPLYAVAETLAITLTTLELNCDNHDTFHAE